MKVSQDNDVLYQQQSGIILAICTSKCIDNWLMAEITASYPFNFAAPRQLEKCMYWHSYDMKWKLLYGINRILGGCCISTLNHGLQHWYFDGFFAIKSCYNKISYKWELKMIFFYSLYETLRASSNNRYSSLVLGL